MNVDRLEFLRSTQRQRAGLPVDVVPAPVYRSVMIFRKPSTEHLTVGDLEPGADVTITSFFSQRPTRAKFVGLVDSEHGTVLAEFRLATGATETYRTTRDAPLSTPGLVSA